MSQLPIVDGGQLKYKVKFLVKIHPDLAENIREIYQHFLIKIEKGADEKIEAKEAYDTIQALLVVNGKIKKT